jgi:hypothetical protein
MNAEPQSQASPSPTVESKFKDKEGGAAKKGK